METKIIKNKDKVIVVVSSKDLIIRDVASAIDFVMSMYYDFGADRIVINKSAIAEDFFILSTCLAGDVLQKYVNYRFKLAIHGDYSKYTSKPLKDFMYECNHGNDIFFLSTEEEAIEKLAMVK
jgi:hypothetical protein